MYRWVDHTADVELAIEAPTEREVLADSLRALAELLEADGEGRASSAATPRLKGTRRILASGADRPALLAAWLEELVFLAESEGFVATKLEELDLRADGLEARVSGHVDDPPPLVKAVTYHGLAFECAESGYFASVVLDV